MNAAHKILTVSYGTFSCTLEGFDDPFNTMKAIAEYFRDLAAEDRYFGAEPPQPDAAMLHKIAEREIQRRVEAKIQDNGVVLRARDDAGAPALAPPAPAPVQTEPAAPAPVVSVTIGQAAEPAPPAAHPAPAVLTEDAAQQAMATAALRLQRLRAAQAARLAPAAPQPEARHAAHPEPAAPLAPAPEAARPQAAAPAAPRQDATIVAEEEALLARLTEAAPELEAQAQPEADLPTEVETPFAAADATVAEAPLPAPVEAVTAAPADAEDSLLASLRETLAGSLDADTLAAPEEPHPAEVRTEAAEDDLPEAMTDATGTLGAFPVTDEDEPSETAFSEPDVEDIAGAAEAFPEAAEDDFCETVALPPLAEARLDDFLPEDAPNVAELDDPLPEDVVEVAAEEAPEAAAEDAATLPEAAAFEQTADGAAGIHPEPRRADLPSLRPDEAPAAEEATTPVVAEKIQRARVIKIRRIDATSAPQPVLEAAPANAPEPVQETARTTDRAEPGDTATALRNILADAPAPKARVAPESDDLAVSRLLQKANSELEEPQTKRRRSAIAHLKAAVLATVAERRANLLKPKTEDQRQDLYRKDLDEVVRPAAVLPAAEKPAPLVLLPIARIDRPAEVQPQRVMPVRPRRVSAALARPAFAPEELEMAEPPTAFPEADTVVQAQSFQDFADGLGAASLHDLIEAAGAYLTLQGRDAFTRPELFRQIDALGAEASREDGLRGFGRLLREGRLTRTETGHYTLAETSPMLVQARRRVG